MSTSLALQDILTSIADGLSQAQQQLNNMPLYDSFGRPATTYHIPYLDFNISLSTKFSETQSFESVEKLDTKELTGMESLNYTIAAKTLIKQPLANQLLFKLPAATATSQTGEETIIEKKEEGKIQSSDEGSESFTTISGRIVAIMPNDGLPQTLLNVSYQEYEKSKTSITFLIKVLLMNTAGEKCARQRVEFNYDPDASLLLNKAIIIPLIKEEIKFNYEDYVSNPVFSTSEVFTNEEGYAETRVSIKREDLDRNFMFVIRVNSGLISKSISI